MSSFRPPKSPGLLDATRARTGIPHSELALSTAGPLDTPDQVLARLAEVTKRLEETYDAADALVMRTQVQALQFIARKRGMDLEVKNRAAQSLILTERRLGELLLEIETRQGARTDLTSDQSEPKYAAIAELQISRSQATRFQWLAQVTPGDLGNFMAAVVEEGRELTAGGAHAWAANRLRGGDNPGAGGNPPLAVLRGDAETVIESLSRTLRGIVYDEPGRRFTVKVWDE